MQGAAATAAAAQADNAVNKTLKGKRISQRYVRMEEIGTPTCCGYQIGQEVPLEELAAEAGCL